MIALTLDQVAAAVGGTVVDVDGAVVVTSVTLDSRAAEPGSLFVALAGGRSDGHDHAAAAVAAGAVAVLAARPVGVAAVLVDDVQVALGRLAHALLALLPDARVIGITGSSGKTSTKDLLAAVIEPLGTTIAPVGSFNNEIGHPLTVLRGRRADPAPRPGVQRPRDRPHRLPVRHRAALDRRRAQRRRGSPRRVRQPRGHRRRQGRAGRRRRAGRSRRAQRGRRPGGGDGRRGARQGSARRLVRAGTPRRRSARRGCRSTPAGHGSPW